MQGLFLDSEAVTTTWGFPKAYVLKWLGVLFVFPTHNQATFRRLNIINLIFHKRKFHKSLERRNNLLSFQGLWGGCGAHPTQVDDDYTIVGCTFGFDCQKYAGFEYL